MARATSATPVLVSVIIPTYNEEEDIAATLDACVALTYPAKEIIVVDDSTDRTPDIVRRYYDRGVRLIARATNEGGRCGARNTGILAAAGEVVIILNADVLLPPGFIDRILPHYRAGAGSVLVESRVSNTDKLIPRFIDAVEVRNHRPELGDWLVWSEGFSCLRKAAVAAGLFPTPPLTVTAGEDGYFGERLRAEGYRKVIDRSIVVLHAAPYTFWTFWRISRERVSVTSSYFLEQKSLSAIFLRALARTVVDGVGLVLIVPALVYAALLSRFSSRGARDIVPFACVAMVRQAAFLVGKWRSFFALLRYRVHRGRT